MNRVHVRVVVEIDHESSNLRPGVYFVERLSRVDFRVCFLASHTKEYEMIGVSVKFHYGNHFDEQAVRKIAETVRGKFAGMPGLRSKVFTMNSEKREATNFYVWDSEDAAKAFFTEELLQRVAGLYGVRPN